MLGGVRGRGSNSPTYSISKTDYMRKLILFLLLFTPNYLLSQNVDYFSKHQEYHYRAIYIDKQGDTITNEKIAFKPLGRFWFGTWSQKALRYVYHTDTAGYKNYVDPSDFFHEKDLRYFAKKGSVRVSASETTGGYYSDSSFYMHPPRTNQYRMLFYAPHPLVRIGKLTDSEMTYKEQIKIYLMGFFNWDYTVTPIPEVVIDYKKVKAWKIYTVSVGEIKEQFKLEKLYNSTLDAIFTKEFGFTMLHYTFENGIKIQFDIEKVVHL
jgi:hypothetical protein